MHIKTLKRKDNVRYLVCVKSRGQYRSRSFDRKHDAVAWGQQMEALLTSQGQGRLTFKVLAEEWLANHSKIKNAASSYMANLSQLSYILPVLGESLICEIGFREIERLTVGLMRAGDKSNRTVNRYLTLVRTILNYAERRGDILKNPVNRSHFFPEKETGYRYWLLSEANRFLAYIENAYAGGPANVPLVYKIALNTGLRWGEIAALKWDSVNLLGDMPSITVQRAYCSKSRQIKETKGKRIRYVGINDVLLDALRETLITRRTSRDELVVSTDTGACLDNQNFLHRHFYRDVREAAVPRIRFHDLRHTYASLFMMNGGNLFDLQKILGHQDIQMTLRYAHLAKEHVLSKANTVIVGTSANVISVNFAGRKSAGSGA